MESDNEPIHGWTIDKTSLCVVQVIVTLIVWTKEKKTKLSKSNGWRWTNSFISGDNSKLGQKGKIVLFAHDVVLN